MITPHESFGQLLATCYRKLAEYEDDNVPVACEITLLCDLLLQSLIDDDEDSYQIRAWIMESYKEKNRRNLFNTLCMDAEFVEQRQR